MHFLKKGQKIRAWVDPPPSFGQCPKEDIFFSLMSSLRIRFFFNIFYISFCRHFESCDFCFLIIHNLPCLVFCLCPDFVDCHEYWLKNRGKGRAILSRRKTQMLRMEIVGLGKIWRKSCREENLLFIHGHYHYNHGYPWSSRLSSLSSTQSWSPHWQERVSQYVMLLPSHLESKK